MAGKRRRTAEESRSLILETAAARLREHGLEGLNITGVAEDAGLSHATLIHHFGSSGGMRDALADKMTLDLIGDLVRAMESPNVSPAELTRNVFSALTEGGHAKLLAWRSIEQSGEERDLATVRELFDRLLATTQKVIDADSREALQHYILLIGTTAIGFGIAGEVLADVLGMSEATVEEFPAWLTTHIN